MREEIWQWEAVRLTQAIARRHISAREATEAILARIDTVNPIVNAVVEICRQEALEAADAADAAIARGERLKPLCGVPITTKINVAQKGTATSNGVVALANNVASEDAPAIANLRRNGAILIGRTNVPAFSWRWFTSNDLYGRTVNPHDPGLTAGGSSGGAAVAVATGMGPIAHGSDLSGSIRYPAYACGVYGFKPTFGRIPNFDPGAPARPILSQLAVTQGLLARSVRDIELALQVIGEPDPRDPWYVGDVPDSTRSTLRIALYRSAPDQACDAEVLTALDRAIAVLSAAGYEVEETTPPEMAALAELYMTLLGEARAGLYERIMEFGDVAIKKVARDMFARAPELTLERYMTALIRRSDILRQWQLFFAEYSLLIAPVSWRLPFVEDFDLSGRTAVEQILDSMMPTIAANLLGLPALAVPLGKIGRIPLGVQIVANRFGEPRILEAARIIEAACGSTEVIDPTIA